MMIDLTEQQQMELFQAVGRRVASIVTRTHGQTISQQVPTISTIPVLGAFVSLKRYGQLRSCMGCMSDQMALGEAVESATLRATKDDPRFPPIAAAELPELDMEVWLLWGMKRVAARGRDRLNAVEIGRHGVQIAMGGNRGLLLPGVAVEHGMDALMFLEAVCRKAGLHSDAWQSDHSLLHTFEGYAVQGPFSAIELDNKKTADELSLAIRVQRLGPREPGPTVPEVHQLRDTCRDTFLGMIEGRSPSHYYPGLFDGNVSGVSLILTQPDRLPLVCSRISVRPDIQLQATLLELLKVLGSQVERFGTTRQELLDAEFDLAVLWAPKIHGNARQYDLDGVSTAARSLMLSSPKGWVIQFRPDMKTSELLLENVDHLSLNDMEMGEVISFETISTATQYLISSLSKPNRAEEVRPPAVAGAFYPAEWTKLNAELDGMFHGASHSTSAYAAVMVPHAGWIYSGRLAAQTLAQVKIPHRAIIFAPKHRPGGSDWSVAPNRIWKLPGAGVESDLDFAERIIQAVDFLQFDAVPHAQEHAIEVQLPLIARLAPKTKIVGIVQAMTSWNRLVAGASQFAAFLAQWEDPPLLIVSSDMNHFATEETTRRVDNIALDAVATLDPQHVWETVQTNQISMCGVVPLVFVMQTLKLLGRLHECLPTGYTTSAERSGDFGRVVGYAGMLFR